MSEDISRWLDSVLRSPSGSLQQTSWQPAADVYQMKDGWLVKFDLAGVSSDDVKLSVAGKRLTASGRRRDHLIEEGASHYRMEISYSSFERSIELPCELTDARLSTETRDGMLLVRVQVK